MLKWHISKRFLRTFGFLTKRGSKERASEKERASTDQCWPMRQLLATHHCVFETSCCCFGASRGVRLCKSECFMLKRTRRRGMSCMQMPSLDTDPLLSSHSSISSQNFSSTRYSAVKSSLKPVKYQTFSFLMSLQCFSPSSIVLAK